MLARWLAWRPCFSRNASSHQCTQPKVCHHLESKLSKWVCILPSLCMLFAAGVGQMERGGQAEQRHCSKHMPTRALKDAIQDRRSRALRRENVYDLLIRTSLGHHEWIRHCLQSLEPAKLPARVPATQVSGFCTLECNHSTPRPA